jgi:hypothetical protein
MPIQGFRRFRAARAGLIALSAVMALGGGNASAGLPEKAPKPPAASQVPAAGPVPNNCTAAWDARRNQCRPVAGHCPVGQRAVMHPVPVGNPTRCTCQCQ